MAEGSSQRRFGIKTSMTWSLNGKVIHKYWKLFLAIRDLKKSSKFSSVSSTKNLQQNYRHTDFDKIVKIRSYKRFIGGKKNDQDQRLKLIQSTELKSLSVSGIPQENWILTFLYDILCSPWLVLASSSSMTGAREEVAWTDINMSSGWTEERRDVQDGNQCDITLWPI